MFSNLVTEKYRSNHLLINTANTKLWNFEEDHVFIVELDSRLVPYKEEWEGKLVPRSELSFMIQESRELEGSLACILKYRGKTLIIKDLKNSIFSEYKWWYRFLSFRAIQIHGPNECKW